MRLLITLLCLAASLAHAAPPKAEAFAPLFELAGIRLLCEQSAPLVQRGLGKQQQAQLARLFAADALCLDLAKRMVASFDQKGLIEATRVLESPLAQGFTAAERAVGEGGAEDLAAYRQQLAERPPREERLQLVKRLDAAAHTTALATLLRYEVGKTQALLTRAGNVGIDLCGLLNDELSSSSYGAQRFVLDGPTVMVPPKAAEVMSLAVHELAA